MKTNNSTKWKYLLFFGLGSLVVGLSLLAFGAATGGIEGIKDNTKAIKEVRTFDNIKNLDINSFYNVTVKSGDVDKVTVTYYAHKKFRPKTSIQHNKETLIISQTERGSFVTGFMETGGYLLNERTGNEDYNETIITVPKNLVIENLNGQLNFHNSQLIDLNIKNINVNGTTYIENVTAEKGIINTYDTYIYKSHLKNITFEGQAYNLSLTDTTLEHSTFNNFHGYLSAENSILKNTTFSAPEQELPDEDDVYWDDYDPYDEYSYSSDWNLDLKNTTLENITYKGDGKLLGHNISLSGKIDFSGLLLSANLKLKEDSRKSTSLDLTTTHGNINLDPKTPEDSGVTINGDSSSFNQKIEQPKAELIIKSKRGDISLQ